jgi:hypothetical protein
VDTEREQPVSGLHIGQILNAAVSRSRTQARLEPAVARFPVYRIVFSTETDEYKAVRIGRLHVAQTHQKVSPQKFRERQITDKSFEKLAASEKEAAEWRDKDVVAAALEWARANQPRGRHVNMLNDALMVVLLAAHGCPAAEGQNDLDLLHVGSYIEPLTVDEGTAVEGSAAA